MCGTCGCSETVTIEEKVLARNDSLASHNRAALASASVFAVNLMSSPGSGKTTLLERTVRSLDVPVSVVEGDQATSFDADRIRSTGVAVTQINTGAGCHLDASMLHEAIHTLSPAPGSVLFVENVGNLVCPALFDLGEAARVVIMSAPEGVDKPLKYPHMFRTADLILLNKVDLLPYLDFPLDVFKTQVRQVNPTAPILHVSATRGDGMDTWLDWLNSHRAAHSPPQLGVSTNPTP
ncbi:hydrogenase nickel incorporation protein HypB [Kibdelosporangium philippinense]|uniref:Hydrogenase nickel incorporation protein HypB n=1 Tax=Kibdelosporangium philippinense TaxID=211113 RepID=A0ABS8ZG75_9PSEU|nr:hydrogenase nickel incorporation protein HypB [Kibdelosporangium philippinense]MCE7006826.1 hydrogenase nickel incorporation protein HypB [Kibdelosporangium philippinense]